MEIPKNNVPDSRNIQDLTKDQVLELLSDHCVGSLGYLAQQTAYVVPVTYYFDRENNAIISYSTEGHKITSLRENPRVSLLVYHNEGMMRWRSVLIHGTFEELHQLEAKYYLKHFSEGVRNVLVKQGIEPSDFIHEFSSKSDSEDMPIVYRIKIQDWTSRYR